MDTNSQSQPSEAYCPEIVSELAMDRIPILLGNETRVKQVVEDLKSSSAEIQRAAAAELRRLAKDRMDDRIIIANNGGIGLLVNLLWSSDPEVQENAVTALLNLSLNDNNKTAIADAGAIELLIHVLQTGNAEAKQNSAATLYSLSVIPENRNKIGKSGAFGPLVELLGNGTLRGKKDAVTALFNLSTCNENRVNIVRAGAVKHLVQFLDPSSGLADKAIAAVLANLAAVKEGREAIVAADGIPVLVELIELGSPKGKEFAAFALLYLCANSNRYCNMALRQDVVPPLVALSMSGTARAKEKAQKIFNHLRVHRRNDTRKT